VREESSQKGPDQTVGHMDDKWLRLNGEKERRGSEHRKTQSAFGTETKERKKRYFKKNRGEGRVDCLSPDLHSIRL